MSRQSGALDGKLNNESNTAEDDARYETSAVELYLFWESKA